MMTKKLSNSHKSIVFDDCDASLIASLKISESNRAIQANLYGTTYQLGRLLVNLTDPNFQCDHKNRDLYDFRRSNLRIANSFQQSWNKDKPVTNNSGYKGVSWDENSKKWKAQIAKNNKKLHIGLFRTAIGAARAWDEKAKELHREFAVLNFPEDTKSGVV